MDKSVEKKMAPKLANGPKMVFTVSMAIDLTTIQPTTTLHEVYDPERRGVIKTGGALACARYINSLPERRQALVVLRKAGR